MSKGLSVDSSFYLGQQYMKKGETRKMPDNTNFKPDPSFVQKKFDYMTDVYGYGPNAEDIEDEPVANDDPVKNTSQTEKKGKEKKKDKEKKKGEEKKKKKGGEKTKEEIKECDKADAVVCNEAAALTFIAHPFSYEADLYGYDPEATDNLPAPKSAIEEYNLNQGFVDPTKLEDYRLGSDTDKEWQYKHKFMETHMFNFPEDRLISLANCWVNVELHGCKYPQQVMDDVKRLTYNMKVEIARHKKNVEQYTKHYFVKSSGHEDKPEDPVLKRKAQEAAKSKYVDPKSKKAKILFVRSSGAYTSTDITHANDPMPDAEEIINNMPGSVTRFANLYNECYRASTDPVTLNQMTGKLLRFGQTLNGLRVHKYKNAIEMIHEVCLRHGMIHRIDQKQSWETLPIMFLTELYVGEVLVGLGRARKKKESKHCAFANALVTLKKKYLVVWKNSAPVHGRLELRSSDESFKEAMFINTEGILDYVTPPKPYVPPKPKEEAKEPEKSLDESKPVVSKAKPSKLELPKDKGVVLPPLNPDPAMRTEPIEPDPSLMIFQDPALPPPDLMYTKKPAIKIAARFKRSELAPQLKKIEDKRPLIEQWRDREKNHPNPKISYFLITERLGVEWDPVEVLTTSISADPQCEGEFSVEVRGLKGMVVIFKMGAEVLAVGKDMTLKDAKRRAAEQALPLLRQWCWTLQEKYPEEAEDKGSAATDTSKQAEKKKEEGTSNGVTIDSVIKRSGFDFKDDTKIMKSAIRKLLENYVKASKSGDMAFSSDFTNDERKVIHKEARKLGLKSKSYTTDMGRYLVEA